MVIIIYSAETEKSIQANMGLPEYSYFFVLKKFRAVLCKFATIVEVKKPETEVDVVYNECQKRGVPCLFFSFSPPHKTTTGLKCLTISVFAWEYPTIPTDTWDENSRNDWRNVFREHGRAITHSSFAVRAVQKAMGNNFPVWSIPAPVWDNYTKLYRKEETSAQLKRFDLTFKGSFVDFDGCDFTSVPKESRKDFVKQRSSSQKDKNVSLHLKGIIYTTVFNPNDGRKNWLDLLSGFIWAFRKLKDVTLILKIIYHNFEKVRETVTDGIFQLMPFQCRVIVMHGYLNDNEYAKLVQGSTYVVNAAYGEGQCLPLMEYMSAGKPAIAPSHTAMEEYINESNSFVVKSSAEKIQWPHDPRAALRTFHYRINWESLYNAYLESYHVAKNDPDRYLRMSGCAVDSLRKYCSKAIVEERLINVFQQCGVPPEVMLSPTSVKEREALRRILLLRIWCFRLFSEKSSFFREPVKTELLQLFTLLRKYYAWLKISISKIGDRIEKNLRRRISSGK